LGGGKVNKAHIVEAVATYADIPKGRAEKAIDGTLKTILLGLRRGERVVLSGFGSFSVRRRKARKARNPRTGEPILIEARKVPRFSPASKLKAAVG
jgi:DNA-binding protein HU-beta